MIALHGAGSPNGAQLYVRYLYYVNKTSKKINTVYQMECAQINVSGGSGSASPQTHSIPGIYKVRVTFWFNLRGKNPECPCAATNRRLFSKTTLASWSTFTSSWILTLSQV